MKLVYSGPNDEVWIPGVGTVRAGESFEVDEATLNGLFTRDDFNTVDLEDTETDTIPVLPEPED